MKLKTNNHVVIALSTLAFLAVIYFFVDVTVLAPAREIQEECDAKEKAIHNANYEASRLDSYKKMLKDYATVSFGRDASQRANMISERIADMIEASGMRKTADKRENDAKVKDVGVEVCRSYSLVGKMQQCADMLLLLRQDPYLHKVDGISVSRSDDGLSVKLEFRYRTLVLKDPTGFKLGIKDVAELRPIATLKKNPLRVQYEGIAKRNLFRPYLKTLPKPIPPKSTKPEKPKVVDIPKPTFDYARYRISELSKFGTVQVIVLEDLIEGGRAEHELGTTVGKATLVKVEYAERADSENPKFKIYSRLVLRFGKELWSVDLGKTLDKRVHWAKDK
ncbi:MAG: hypothetical protein HN909_02455 [Phycisphaerales bacterium]|jgi:hypothetical protein|nr:hypothetical protein [Phycisphaerales bacterium]MBT7170612.1 hypothetical protein [Phycisphaerales bacterium]